MRAIIGGLVGGFLAVLVLGGGMLLYARERDTRATDPTKARALLLAQIDRYEREVYRPYAPPDRDRGEDWRPLQLKLELFGERHPELGAYVAWCLARFGNNPFRTICYDPYVLRHADMLDPYLGGSPPAGRGATTVPPTPRAQATTTPAPTPVPGLVATHVIVDYGQAVNLRAGPSATAGRVAPLPPGTRLAALGEEARDGDVVWLKFQTERGDVGWIRTVDVTRLP